MSNQEQPTGNNLQEWPYPVNYDKENEVVADVLVLGGGLAGCHAAINAARRGAKVVLVEKGAVIRSGQAGSGIDHWYFVCKAPGSKVSPEEATEATLKQEPFDFGHTVYIPCMENYDALLDIEKMGVEFRDVDDEFAGAPFRDEETRIMFAYDYVNKHTIRLRGGAKMKPALYNELKRLGVIIYDHVMATSLLTEGGKSGARVVGGTGVNVRTGEFYVFAAKSTVLTTSVPAALWIFSTELSGAGAFCGAEPNMAGDGNAMGWQAGAEFTTMEYSQSTSGGFSYPNYGVGNAGNTWFACTIVDANGKEVPWVDKDGNVLKTVAERYLPAPGDNGISFRDRPHLIRDLPERIRKGEFVLPLYADLPGMPQHERRAIWGLMVGNEGKTRIPVYDLYSRSGFDPDKDMLQAVVMPPDAYAQGPGYGPAVRQWRDSGPGFTAGGMVVDWDLKTTLEGLYAAGNTGRSRHGGAGASSTGRYAGRKAAAYAAASQQPVVDRKQVQAEKDRVYAPVKRKNGVGWKELQAGLCRIMQDYCGEYKSEEVLETGLRWFKSIRESEASRVYAKNPHELKKVLECFSRLTCGEMVMYASLARKASSQPLNFNRIDYPEKDPPEWNKFVTIKQENGAVKVGEMPMNFWLLPPYAPTYEENYRKHCDL
ncbi:MAG: FAD-dependent oxidoreductase [Dehalococcoidales bacterium]|nr:FAD-dependent oxidoreductase [Dehalococcoidales bacterium]